MEHIIHNLSLNMQSSISQVSLSVKKGDTMRKLCITLTDNGTVYRIAEGCEAVLSAKKESGWILYNNCTIDYENNIIVYEFTHGTAIMPGKMDCEIKLYDANKNLITSPQFSIIVNNSVHEDGEVEDSNEFSVLTKLISEAIAVDKELNLKLAGGKLDFANAVKGQASGEVVSVNDISPAIHTVKVKVKSKNMIPFQPNTTTTNGVTFTINSDGSVSAVGSATDTAIITLKPVSVKANKTYWISSGVSSSSNSTYQMWMSGENVGVGNKYNISTTSFVPAISGSVNVYLYVYKGSSVDVTFFPMLNEGDAALPFTSYVQSSTVQVIVNGTETYTTNADGTCDVASVYPAMSLQTDNANAYIECEYNRDISAVFADLSSRSRISYIDLLASKWQGAESPYSQVVAVEGATENSQVDLTPSVEQLSIFHNKDLAFVTENEDGVVTVYAIGQKPTNDYRIQVTITEVVR